jgi:DNA-binding transcriptional LysR family regulator
MIELRQIRVFLTLAEELHFGHTAKRLGITPSRVSQDLRKLERLLGDQVLHRTSRRVTLTPFGQELLAAVGPAYQQLTGALMQAQAATHRLEGTLRLGLLPPTAGGRHLTAIIQAFEQRYPDCEIHVSEMLLDDPLGPLLRRNVRQGRSLDRNGGSYDRRTPQRHGDARVLRGVGCGPTARSSPAWPSLT